MYVSTSIITIFSVGHTYNIANNKTIWGNPGQAPYKYSAVLYIGNHLQKKKIVNFANLEASNHECFLHLFLLDFVPKYFTRLKI